MKHEKHKAALRVFVAHPSALLTDHLPHGDGLVAHGFISELGRRGHELHIAAQRVDLREPLPPSVHIHRLPVSRAPAPLDRLGFMRRMRGLYDRLSSEAPFDLAHQLNPVDVGLSLALAGRGLPVVLGPYVPEWPGQPKPGGRLLRPAAMYLNRALRAAQQRRATTVLLSTPAAGARIAVEGQGLLVREVSPGIDASRWLPGEEDGIGQDILFLANLEVRKGIRVVLDAFSRVASEMPEARLLVAGQGSELEHVRARIRASPDLARVVLLGHVERGQVAETMRASDIYCLPSYAEPFGMTALEAMACGKPVVATRAGGLEHLVPDEGGRKVPPGDADALAGALVELLRDPGLRRAMGEHNRHVVQDRYSWSRVVDRLEDAYREAIGRPASR